MPSSDLLKPARRISGLGQLISVRYWHKADITSCTAHVRFRV